MIIAVDFDSSIVEQRGDYNDVTTPLVMLEGAPEALRSLKRAGHVVLVFSARANRALRVDPDLDPLVRAGKKRIDPEAWKRSQPINEARYQQMLRFASERLRGVVDAVDDGMQGKPCADLFIDDRAVRLGNGPAAIGWKTIALIWGEPVYDEESDHA